MGEILDLLLNSLVFGGIGSPRPATAEEGKMQLTFAAIVIATFLFFGILAFGLFQWRIAHFPHAVATITSVRGETLARDGKQIVVGTIAFTRSHNGKSFYCQVTTELGEPSKALTVGDKLDIVPATGTCQRFDVIGRIQN